jgi:4-amino-4-deoxy-L-arabinose transferase-like glycosyltransferase
MLSLRSQHAAAWAAGSCALFVLLASTKYGLALWPDSVDYLFAAGSITRGQGPSMLDGQPWVYKPPLYPALLAALSKLGVSVLNAALVLNVAASAFLVWCGARAGERFLTSRAAKLLLCVGLAVSPVVLTMGRTLLAEAAFNAVTMAFLIELSRALEGRAVAPWLRAGALSAVACLTRYSGVTLLLTLCAVGAFTWPRRHPSACIWACLLGGAGFSAWPLHNWISGHPLFGERAPSLVGLLENTSLVTQTVGAWLLPVTFAVVAVLLGIRSGTREGRGRLLDESGGVLLAFCGVFVAFTLLTSSRVAMDPIGDRMLSPCYVPLLLLACRLLDGELSRAARPLRLGALGVASAVCVAHVMGAVAGTLSRASGGAGGYASRDWQEALAPNALLRPASCDGPLLTNAPEGLYAVRGEVAGRAPRKFRYASRVETGDLERLRHSLGESSACLLWLTRAAQPHYYSPEELSQSFDVQIVQRSEGATYFALRLPAAPRKQATQRASFEVTPHGVK